MQRHLALYAFILALMLTGPALADGTGFIVSAQGHVLTSYHVVRQCSEVRANYNGERLPLQEEATDPKNDLALYRLMKATPNFARFPKRGEVRPGDSVLTLGFPLPGLLASQASVTKGVVSATAGPGDDPRFLQISVPIQSGNSGGPLLGLDGSVFGLVFAKLDTLSLAAIYGEIPQTINFAIKEPILRAFLWRHGVPIVTSNDERTRAPADIAAYARSYTLFTHCAHPKPPSTITKSAPRAAPVGETNAARARIAPTHAETRESRNWTIRLGMFQNVRLASNALIEATNDLEELLVHSEITIIPVPTSNGLLYQAIVSGLGHRAAGQACHRLHLRGQTCVAAPLMETAPIRR